MRSQSAKTNVPFLEGVGAWKVESPYLASSSPKFFQLIEKIQSAGLQTYQKQGLPTLKTEGWQFTSLRNLLKLNFSSLQDVPLPENLPEHIKILAHTKPTIFFLNGTTKDIPRPWINVVFDEKRMGPVPYILDEKSIIPLPGAVDYGPLSHWQEKEHEITALGSIVSLAQPFVALNTAHLHPDNAYVIHFQRVAFETTKTRPQDLHLVFISKGGEAPLAAFPRLLVKVEAGVKARLTEHHITLGNGAPVFTNMVTEVELGAGSTLHHTKIQTLSSKDFHMAHIAVRAHKDAQFHSFVLQEGGELARDEISIKLAEPGAHAELLGVYKAKGTACIDNTTLIDHAVPHCTSKEVYHGIIDDQARGVFQGKVLVRPQAQKTDAQQMNRALLLSEAAQIDSKPELQIYADDVKCSHGATVGELDEQALFYLRSRGMGLASARALLIQAFLSEVIESIKDESVRNDVVRYMERNP